ncbi:hypothetical protein AGABI1DRAFT_132665 [Agaricus bisporus var. burnettii JB137-S8]|uniref:Uncharacterized protein n=1 Tax=Agaricus bisporus var. burnettii (strain JB137-S8 / ATCC MYA-4627 / FGSC 10392) TaxID=597362 RepID=K5WIE3_AGABU|nr:uncharacterized protein AGABI1DRAFT_132665 [Agaricus bisporus var. burnettii JB137-S8]EKM75046.1 hypothetical protein AGABI1DRAFT_132665 [Agaricus bisporus var. burnettii JB137-S8]
MASLEWHWNMRYGALHLNTRHNIFFAGAALHLHHDNNAWGLLPDKEYIYQYYEKRFADRNEFPQIHLPEGGFKYKLIPLGDSMRTFPILRQNEHGQPPNKDQYTIYLYPFDDMPTFRTHLHPKFAIYELGRKVHALVAEDGAVATRAFRTYQDLERVYDVFASWSALQKNSARFEEWKNQGNTEGDGDVHSESSSKTGVDSWRNGVKRRRTEHADEQGSPTPAGRNSDVMQIEDLSCKSLSQETMIEHERFYGKEGWTQESLSGWIADASKHVTAHV